MNHVCTQNENIKIILKRVNQLSDDFKNNPDHAPANKTIKMISNVQSELAEHRKAQQEHEEVWAEWIKKQDRVLIFVEKNLIPAYEREINAENAKKWIKEQAKSGSFWIGIIMSIIGFFWAIMYIIKQSIK